jgi:hypothetical protein
MSATVRSLVYLIALARSGPHGRLSIVLVEIAYVTLTGGVYAGLQQRALSLRSVWLGNGIVAFGVPCLAQLLDWLAHRAAGSPVPFRATLAVSGFATISALFHLFVMRCGVFLTGRGQSLGEDFRKIPQLMAGFVAAPVSMALPAALSLIGSTNGRGEAAVKVAEQEAA